MVKTKKQHQQKKNDQGGGNQKKKKKSKIIAIPNTNGNRNGNGSVWRAEEEYEIDLLDSRKTATGELEGCVQWKAVGKTEWVVSATVCFGTDLLYRAMALPTNSQ